MRPLRSLLVVLLGGTVLAGLAASRERRPPQAAQQAPSASWAALTPSLRLPRLGRLPDFRLTAVTTLSQGPLSLADLSGRPWVAGFIYTSCAGPCPLLSARMAGLQGSLPPQVRLVSFTVDPQRDRPKVLRAYAARFKADPRRWVFLTGPKPELRKLMSEGFRLAAGEDPKAPVGLRLVHSTKLVLVDSEGILRGYYDGQEPSSLRRLERDALALLR